MFETGSAIRAAGGASEKPLKLSADELTQRLEPAARRVYYGGVMIAVGDTLEGPVAVIKGALDIQDRGVLIGDAWIVNGKLILNGRAVVTGAAGLVNSAEYLSRHAVVRGGVTYYSCECALDADTFEESGTVSFLKEEDPKAVKIKPAVQPGNANRTRYELVRIGLERRNPRHRDPYVGGHAVLHVPIWNENGGFLGFDVDLIVPLRSDRFDLVLKGFKRTWTNDDWQISRTENAFIMMFTGDDFLDYHERRGGAVGIRMRAAESVTIETGASFQEDVSLRAGDIPSLFKGYDRYRENLPIDDGERLALTALLTFDTRYDRIRPAGAWYASVMLEKGLADGPGDFSYTAFEIDLRRYNSLPFGLHLDIRGRCFSSLDQVPRQVMRSVNGYGGIRGADDFPFAVHRGNRLAFLSIEVRAGIPDPPLLRRFLTRWDMIVFTDMGLLVMEERDRRTFDFLEAPFDDWVKTVGIGFSAESILPYVGIYIAQDLDREEFEPRVVLRAERSF
jgi:hypothetical protein